MNILFVTHGLYPCKVGGAEIFNYYLIKALTKYHKIFVITCCKEKVDLEAALIRINPRKFGLARFSIPLQDVINILKLRDEIDLIHISYMRAHWLQWLPYPIMRKISGVPYIVTIHGGGMHKWKPEFAHKFLFKNAASIIAISQRIKKEYEKRTGRNIKFIPPLIPFRKCEENRERLRDKYGFGLTDTIILSLGSIKKIKGSDVLLTAFIKLEKEYIEKYKLKLLFVGDGDIKKELAEKTKKEDFEKHVKFLGNIPYEDVSAVFRMADIYIIPSLFEGTPISMLEAMFNGIPIIGSDVNGINNIIEHGKNGLLFEVSNRDDLKDKIVYLIKNKNIAEEIANNAKKDYMNNYNFETVVKQYIELYEKLNKRQIK